MLLGHIELGQERTSQTVRFLEEIWPDISVYGVKGAYIGNLFRNKIFCNCNSSMIL